MGSKNFLSTLKPLNAQRLQKSVKATVQNSGRLTFAMDAVKDMKKRFGIGDTIPEIWEEDIPKLARYADKEANPLYPVPVLMSAKELEQFYYMLMEK